MEKPISNYIVEYVSKLNFQDLKKEVIHATKRFLLDTLGSILVGTIGEPYKIARRVYESAESVEEASIVLSSKKVWVPHAAFINGVALRFCEYSGHLLVPDLKGACHCDENVPSILAVSEKTNATGKQVIVALALAAELHARFLEAVDMHVPGWHHTTAGIYVVPLVCGKLFGLSKNQLLNALGISGSFGITLEHIHYIGPVSMMRNLGFPLAAQHGITADLLALEGYTGPSGIIDGEFGLFSQDKNFHPEKLIEIESPTRLLHYFNKLTPVSGMMCLVDATRNIREKNGVTPENVKKITVKAPPSMVPHSANAQNRVPKTKESADHSAYYVVARTLIDGDLTIDGFTLDKIVDPRTAEIIEKIEVIADPALEEMKKHDPVAQPFKVEIETLDGQKYDSLVDHARGYGRNRLSDDQLKEKFRFLASKVISETNVGKVITFVDELEDQAEILSLTELLR